MRRVGRCRAARIRPWLAALVLVPTAGSAACRSPVPTALEPWTAFQLDFEDGSLRAGQLGGPRDPEAVLGEPAFAAGRFGSALRLGAGGSRVHFGTRGTLDFTRPGSLAFWVSPLSWERSANAYVPFFVAGTPGGASFNLQRDARRAGDEQEHFVVGLFALPGGRRMHFLRLETERWRNGSWHLVALRWDRLSFGVSIDGGDFVSQGVPDGEWQRSFSPDAAGARWRLGATKGEATAIDEFRIFARPLQVSEVRALFEARPPAGCRGHAASPR